MLIKFFTYNFLFIVFFGRMTKQRKRKKKSTNRVQLGASSLNTVSNSDSGACQKVAPNLEECLICVTGALSKHMMERNVRNMLL